MAAEEAAKAEAEKNAADEKAFAALDRQGFIDATDTFVKEHCGVFDPNESEGKNEYMELFTLYGETFESALEAALEGSGMREEAYEAAMERLAGCEDEMGERIQAMADFDAFMAMMMSARQKADEEKANALFDRLDTNGDGVVDREEYVTGMAAEKAGDEEEAVGVVRALLYQSNFVATAQAFLSEHVEVFQDLVADLPVGEHSVQETTLQQQYGELCEKELEMLLLQSSIDVQWLGIAHQAFLAEQRAGTISAAERLLIAMDDLDAFRSCMQLTEDVSEVLLDGLLADAVKTVSQNVQCKKMRRFPLDSTLYDSYSPSTSQQTSPPSSPPLSPAASRYASDDMSPPTSPMSPSPSPPVTPGEGYAEKFREKRRHVVLSSLDAAYKHLQWPPSQSDRTSKQDIQKLKEHTEQAQLVEDDTLRAFMDFSSELHHELSTGPRKMKGALLSKSVKEVVGELAGLDTAASASSLDDIVASEIRKASKWNEVTANALESVKQEVADAILEDLLWDTVNSIRQLP